MDLHFDSSSRARWSEPFQLPRPWDLDESTSSNRAHSKHQSINLSGHGVPGLTCQHSHSSLSAPESLFNKPETQFSETELPAGSCSTAPGRTSKPLLLEGWIPSYLQISPLLGIAALLVAFLQIFASYALLSISNGHPVEDWTYRPAVYIGQMHVIDLTRRTLTQQGFSAVLTVISNKAISFGAIQGAVVTFWLRALRGTTLGQLHRDWEYGSDVYYALRAGKHINLLAIACILATIVGIDGALLQRASFVVSDTVDQPIELKVSISPEVPSYFTGLYQYGPITASPVVDYSSAMLPVLRTPKIGGVTGCEGQCTVKINAPALIVDRCDSESTFRNFSTPYTPKQLKAYEDVTKVPVNRFLYGSWISSSKGRTETLKLTTLVTSDDVAQTCSGLVNVTHCYLKSAIAEYEAVVRNDSITLSNPAYPNFVAWSNNTALTPRTISEFSLRSAKRPGFVKTTLGGVVNAFLTEFSVLMAAEPPKTPGHLDIGDVSKSWFLFQHITNYEQYTSGEACSYAWKDPRPAIMAGLNELMFRVGVHAASYDKAYLKTRLDPNLETQYSTIGIYHSPHNVFETDFRFFYAAAALEFLTIVLVASTFSGFWRLGRNVSLSPLEIAKAFDAPLLSGVDSNLKGRKIASLTKSLEVQYGVVGTGLEMDEKGRKTEVWAISHQESVHVPDRQVLNAREHYYVVGCWIRDLWKARKFHVSRR